MSSIGKAIRLERIIDRNTKKTIIIPMDHGMSVGPIKGIINLSEMINKVVEGGANAILHHIGMPIYGHRKYGRDVGLIIHLSASTSLGPFPNSKVQVTSIEDAIKFGADAVSVHINIGDEREEEMLATLGKVSSQAFIWGMPLLAMMYPRGHDIRNEHDVQVVKHVARIAAELGADIVKTNYTGSIETFKEVTRGCGAPVVIAGGPKIKEDEKSSPIEKLLKMTKDSIEAGGSGVAYGRNVFQAKNPTVLVKAL
ncbi:MAG: 2-amino-3,7-dideoxy-D-threo-hept-6-ulosonate synthase, partial [Candidatus Hodarchaeota archaeon]